MDHDPSLRLGRLVDDRLRLTSILGSGSFAVVFLAIDIKDPAQPRYAVKSLCKAGLSPPQIAIQRREANVMRKLTGHPNIVRLVRTIETPQYLYLVMEYCEMDLYDVSGLTGS
ncbi:kinase-like domain-containing protein [Blyttiomyces helicus]|uniref:Kinase-like domain-containing protein n=1 Tax=Blyttiomyces helicus TaxID=388810 RepID=A0A4P9W6Z4_9FUNG|nr:kinase-like domain-containing protein [Blyttiomyces helicus]|eukprot:RKO87812.1 kinase-like domain-containing protein [Blyttiomyces helicus]